MTDAYMFAVSYPEGTEAKNAKDFFIAYGSALRRGNETYFSSLAKLFVIQKAEGKKLDLWIDGQPKINTTFRSTKKPMSVEVNDKKIPVVYQKSQIKVKLKIMYIQDRFYLFKESKFLVFCANLYKIRDILCRFALFH